MLRKADKPYDRETRGIISTNPGVLMGSIDGENKEDKRMLALSGRVPVKIDPDSPPIEVGDFLTSSDKPGLAMKATKAGYTVGKALEGVELPVVIASAAWRSHTDEIASSQTPRNDNTCKPTIEVFVNLGYFAGELTEDGFLAESHQKPPLVKRFR